MRPTLKFIVLFCVIALPLGINAQDTILNTTSEIKIENSSDERYIETYVAEGTFQLGINISCFLDKGSLRVKIILEETGEIFGSFAVGGSTTKEKNKESKFTETVKSEINKVIKEPLPGNYIIKIIAENANASLNVNIQQFSK
jgi:hypothetical protein